MMSLCARLHLHAGKLQAPYQACHNKCHSASCSLPLARSVPLQYYYCVSAQIRPAGIRSCCTHLPAAQGSPTILTDEEGVIAFLQDDFMGGAETASAVETFLHAIASFRKMCVEQFGG